MKYIGESCTKCGAVFTEDDDIVVCPDCGSPHHRECYKTDNACSNSHKHGDSFKWEPSVPHISEDTHEPEAFCPFCNYKVKPDAEECPRCKQSLAESGTRNENGIVPNSFPLVFGMEHDKSINGAKAWELVYFVARNPVYYVPLFNLFAETGKKISFNLFCFIFPPAFFAYRRMWGWAILTTIISVLLALPITISYFVDAGMRDSSAAFFSQPVMDIIYQHSNIINSAAEICNVLDFALRLLMCLFGNRLYYGFATRAVKELRKSKNGADPTVRELHMAGGTRLLNIVGILVLSMLFTATALTASKVFFESLL